MPTTIQVSNSIIKPNKSINWTKTFKSQLMEETTPVK